MGIKTTCPVCGKETVITVNKDAYEKYQNGGLVQNCFPELSPEIREMLITGICPTCWDKIMNIGEDEI